MGDDHIIVFMTAPSEVEGVRLGTTLVEEGLCACCNVVPGVRSIYTWKGRLCDDKEVLCLLKTRRKLFKKLRKRIKELHPYDVPEIVAVKIKEGSKEYLKWIDEATGR